MWKIIDRSHAKTEATSRRVSVKRVKCAKECFMARYRSPLIKAMWNKEAEITTLDKALVKTCNAHVSPEISSVKTVISKATFTGCTMTPTTKSVEASKASTMFDLCSLRRGFFLMAIITSTFKAAVRGNVRVLTIMIIIRKAWVSIEGWWSLPPQPRRPHIQGGWSHCLIDSNSSLFLCFSVSKGLGNTFFLSCPC